MHPLQLRNISETYVHIRCIPFLAFQARLAVALAMYGCAATHSDAPSLSASDENNAVVLAMQQSQRIDGSCLEVSGKRPNRDVLKRLVLADIGVSVCTSERLIHRITVKSRQSNQLVVHHHVACRDFCEPGDAFVLTLQKGSDGKLDVVGRRTFCWSGKALRFSRGIGEHEDESISAPPLTIRCSGPYKPSPKLLPQFGRRSARPLIAGVRRHQSLFMLMIAEWERKDEF